MSTLNLGLVIDQGADFSLLIQVDGDCGPTDLTGYSFLGEMRSTTEATSPLVAEFSFAIQDQFLNAGQVLMSLPAATIDEIVTSIANPLQRLRRTTPFVFDVKMEDTNGNITRILQGIANVSPQATQENFS
jgi:hypothetical protein